MVSAVAPVRFNRIEIDPTGVAARLFPDGFWDPRECFIRTEAAPCLSRRRAVQVHIGSWPHLALPGLAWYRSLLRTMVVAVGNSHG